jgi:hypothetical protein
VSVAFAFWPRDDALRGQPHSASCWGSRPSCSKGNRHPQVRAKHVDDLLALLGRVLRDELQRVETAEPHGRVRQDFDGE